MLDFTALARKWRWVQSRDCRRDSVAVRWQGHSCPPITAHQHDKDWILVSPDYNSEKKIFSPFEVFRQAEGEGEVQEK